MEGHTDMLYMYRMLNAGCIRTGLCTPCLVGFFLCFIPLFSQIRSLDDK